MGTNYYADWKPEASVTIQLHICKSFTGYSGRFFPSWDAWKTFLTHNPDTVTIRDEYGDVIELEEFVGRVEAVPKDQRRRHYQWLVDHGHPLDRDWLDPDGFSFYRGEFS